MASFTYEPETWNSRLQHITKTFLLDKGVGEPENTREWEPRSI
jgi:hypothetical protein